ncbi:MAG: Gamma-glutamyltransferase [Solirubrobacterales bacterium]|nr:Gamma-glutamyltransferase [Solirubrobacterales bacterium]
MSASPGVVAAGHPLTAEAGAAALRAGGNAVDAALAAMLASTACEPLLTGLGAGGYMLVVPPGGEPVLLDFFVEAAGRGVDLAAHAPLHAVDVSFGDAHQVFNIGPSSVGCYGVPAGIEAAAARFGTLPLSDLVAPAAALAREGVPLNAQQAYIFAILSGIVTATPEAAALHAPGGAVLREGERFRNPDLADALERLGREGAAPFYTGEIADAVTDWLAARGGVLTRADLAAYGPIEREPVRVGFRGREVLTNPPPSAGGVLIAYVLGCLDREPAPTGVVHLVELMERAQAARDAEFLDGLAEPGFADRFLASRLGSTTHISVLDRDGWAAGVTCSNGACSGEVVPGTGLHLNNMLGEQDLNPLGYHRYRPGRRMPSMMSPTAVLRDGVPELVLGSAGSNRIRSAIIQTVLGVVDRGLEAQPAVDAPRVHVEDGTVWAEPGLDVTALEAAGRTVSEFRDRNVFFGGVQAVHRSATGALRGAGDPRRGGAVVVA